MYQKYFKRILDICASLIGLVLLSPLFIVVAILVRINLGSPVIFKQRRPGKKCEIFEMYKFRTMTDEKDENGILLSDEMRLTKFGKFLRNTSLDELPELFNILKGDMSLVGPRPQLIRDMVFFNEEQLRRQDVLPGLTGLAQISGRNDIEWEQKFYYDLKYLKEITFKHDLEIILMTILKVFKSEGINTQGMATAEDFGDYLLRTNKINKKQYETKIALSKEF
ncbi:sugar transferase [Turicibacter sanguinis]|uniref:sugar transferase n=1 Tax=Turicibacter sanguinis TaxID=154288 RepID=UPI0018AA15B5|nr:sugar transferase [Turicibacter sanguinis]